MIKTVLLRCDRFKMETKYKMKVDERKQAESNRWQFNKKKKIKEKKMIWMKETNKKCVQC